MNKKRAWERKYEEISKREVRLDDVEINVNVDEKIAELKARKLEIQNGRSGKKNEIATKNTELKGIRKDIEDIISQITEKEDLLKTAEPEEKNKIIEEKAKLEKVRDENVAKRDSLRKSIEKIEKSTKSVNTQLQIINKKMEELTKDKYSVYTQLEKNIPLVKNVLDYRAKLEEKSNNLHDRIKAIDTELNRRERVNEVSSEVSNIQAEQERVAEEIRELVKKENEAKQKLSETKDSSDKIVLETYLNKVSGKIDEKMKISSELTNKMYAAKKSEEKVLKDNEELPNNPFGKMSDEMLKQEKLKLIESKSEVSTKISKCNLVCNNLMQGKKWDEIDLALDNYDNRRYKEKYQIDLEKVKEPKKQADRKIIEEQEKDVNPDEEKIENLNSEIQKLLEEKEKYSKPVVTERKGIYKLPLIGKMLGVIKRNIDTRKNEEKIKEIDDKIEAKNKELEELKSLNSKEQIQIIDFSKAKCEDLEKMSVEEINRIPQEELIKLPKEEQEKFVKTAKYAEIQEYVKKLKNINKDIDKNKSFKMYIKEIAEKGIDKAQEDKRNEMRQKAIERQNEKFDEDYSKRSGDDDYQL